MTRLSDTQLLILNAAAQRDDGNALPLPDSLRGGAATKVVGALLSRGLVAEHVTDSIIEADPALSTFWRNDDEGHGVVLRITDAARRDRRRAGGLRAGGCGAGARHRAVARRRTSRWKAPPRPRPRRPAKAPSRHS